MSDPLAQVTVTVAQGEVRAWLDKERNLHLKAVTEFGDPVELTEVELSDLISGLIRLREAMD